MRITLVGLLFAVVVFLGPPEAANSQPNGDLPRIQMSNVPITMAIENLARQSGINFIIDPNLFGSPDDSNRKPISEPLVTFSWTNVAADYALSRLLKEHGLVLVEDKFTTIARIACTNKAVSPMDVSLLGNSTNVIPLIQFQDVPITSVLENLARYAGIDYVLDTKIGYGTPDKDGRIKTEPLLSLRWEKVSAKQAFAAICENYDLIAVKSSIQGSILIKPKD